GLGTFHGMTVTHLNDPVGVDKLIESLAGADPVHGTFDWDVEKVNDGTISIFGRHIRVTAEKSLANIPYKDMRIDIVEECSGFFGDDKKDPKVRLSDEFFKYGVKRVIQSYPANADATIIMGVNHETYDSVKHRLISNGSCTTKALAAPLRVLMDNGISVDSLLMDTVHAATNSQNILESLDQIWTHKTGAARATGLVIPSLQGRMDGISFRVPTSDGSFANLYAVVTYGGELTAKMVNGFFEAAVGNDAYQGRLAVFAGKDAGTKHHIVGNTANGVVVLDKTRVLPLGLKGEDGRNAYLLSVISGYDNERGPPMDQVLLTEYVAGKD
ncbi:MAG: glyceraldehyde 3-phosphate dehydrogenase NAD-binding domain-containing protein, partial [Nanoarchaeota archaeon]